jgi:hypothetical protein
MEAFMSTTQPTVSLDAARQLFRHTLAVLAYRGGKAIRNAPPSFAGFRVSETSRTPLEILAHVGDLMVWAISIARGEQKWSNSKGESWEKETARFHTELKNFDDLLASGAPVHESFEKLMQGPVADALTHVGQITMLRRAAGCPIRGENYHRASISAGVVGADQPAANREFD